MRGLITVATLCALVIDRALGQPNPYFPATVGSTWHFDGVVRQWGPGAGEPVTVRISSEIRKSVRMKGYTHVEARMLSGGLQTGTDTYQVTPREVRRVSTGRNGVEVMKPPLTLLRLPATAGSRWNWNGTKADTTGKPFPATAVVSIEREERVEVPAGTFRAVPVRVRIEATVHGTRVYLPATIWFARGVGMVRIEGRVTNGQGRGMHAKLRLGEYSIRQRPRPAR